MQNKTTRLSATSERTGLRIKRSKSKVMRSNKANKNIAVVGGEPFEEPNSFINPRILWTNWELKV